mmetsp:Transcript_51795/g.123260  ORF Transcript_51795/g.123260 Transcript_51795/m.123260 type:complete len:375 (-) Transcript_51795:8-1132(-)
MVDHQHIRCPHCGDSRADRVDPAAVRRAVPLPVRWAYRSWSSSFAGGCLVGAFVASCVAWGARRDMDGSSGYAAEDGSGGWFGRDLRCLAREVEEGRRQLLPEHILFLRHGQSEGNVDKTAYQQQADNLIPLTPAGVQQAEDLGHRLKAIVGDQPLVIFVSPFLRTFQTVRALSGPLENNIVRTEIDPALAEQEFGNIQYRDFVKYRKEQSKVGRFWYRFPTGESGADVYHRAMLFWQKLKLLNVNPKKAPVDWVLVVTHGLAMRMLLMRLFSWSPITFEAVFNAENCEIWALKKNLSKPGDLPYDLDMDVGVFPKSSRTVILTYADGHKRKLVLMDYLKLEPPRTQRKAEAIQMLAKEYGFHPSEVVDINFFL